MLRPSRDPLSYRQYLLECPKRCGQMLYAKKGGGTFCMNCEGVPTRAGEVFACEATPTP